MNKFETAYQEFSSIEAAFFAAEKRGDEAGMEKARADVEAFKARYEAEGEKFASIYASYKTSRKNGNGYLNINSYIRNVEEFSECLKKNGITKFTFSSGWSGAIENAMELQKSGWRMTGLTEVLGEKKLWSSDREILAALVFEA